jgi:hypothetical protein
MATITITPRGPFSLAASGAFLEGFAPARYPGNAPDGAIRLAFPADDGRATIGAAVRQAAMADAYHLANPTPGQLADLAGRWHHTEAGSRSCCAHTARNPPREANRGSWATPRRTARHDLD